MILCRWCKTHVLPAQGWSKARQFICQECEQDFVSVDMLEPRICRLCSVRLHQCQNCRNVAMTKEDGRLIGGIHDGRA